MDLTEFPTEEVPAKLEEFLRSGWAFLLADNDIIQGVEKQVRPEEFRMMITPGTGHRSLFKVIVLVKVDAFLSREPDREKIRAIWCKWKTNPEQGELVVMMAAFEDEEISGLVKKVLEE